ncbi:MAG: alpha amylase C-terminal domain-containing protein [Candidatus Azobacteroides sp.]|nr:alpha amylase C-terminal domain-containing protein [Candidatus Azobacteroides sp.]
MKKIQYLLLSMISCLLLFSGCKDKPQQDSAGNDSEQSSLPYPEWVKNAVIYEVNVRQYSPEGTFKAFDQHLDRLKDLGVDILWFMPIHPIGEKNRKGTLGSYYAVKNYKEVNPEFGTAEDFRETVKKAHDMGFKVLIDWVANHTSPDNPWVTSHSEWYQKDSLGNIIVPYDWTDTAQLDYTNDSLREAMIDAMKYWIQEFDIDGFRCDMAGLVPVDFWEKAREELDAIKPVFMLAEDEEKNELADKAFDGNYGWEMHHIFADIYKGEKNATDIVSVIQKYDSIFPANSMKLNFITNHDENSWNGTIEEKFGAGEKAFALLSYTIPGMPLIYSGQEANVKKRIEFFEKDPISWEDTSLYSFYKELNRLKHTNEALFNPPYGGAFIPVENSLPQQVISFERKGNSESIYSIINLSNKEVSPTLKEMTEGEYTMLISSQSTDNVVAEQNKEVQVTLEPWGYRVMKSKK